MDRRILQTSASRFFSAHERYPAVADMKTENDLPSVITFKKHVGLTPEKYIKSLSEPAKEDAPPKRRGGRIPKWTAERCTQAVEEFYQNNHRAPNAKEMTPANGLPGYAVFKKAMAQTPRAYCLATFKPAAPKDIQAKTEQTQDNSLAYQMLHMICTKLGCGGLTVGPKTLTLHYKDDTKKRVRISE